MACWMSQIRVYKLSLTPRVLESPTQPTPHAFAQLSCEMARRDRSHSPDAPHKRVRPSHRSSPRSPSPTRRNQRPPRSRYDDDREWDRERDRDRDRDRERDRDRDRYRDDRYRDDRRRDYRDDRRDDRRRSRSRERRERDRAPPTPPRATTAEKDTSKAASATPPVEDEKLKAKRAKLEAWKKEREAKKALDEAKAKAMALAGKSAPGMIHLLV